jgi:hypothetical protein
MLGFKTGQESIKTLTETLHKDNRQLFIGEFTTIINLSYISG